MTLIRAECSMSYEFVSTVEVRSHPWERGGERGCYGFSEVRIPHPALRTDLSPVGRGETGTGCPADVPPSRRHFLSLPIHLRAASSPLARSSGLRLASASSSAGSPLPAVLATMCHFRPSILSIGAPCPETSTRARRFCAIGLFCRAALRSSATPAASFFGVPVPL